MASTYIDLIAVRTDPELGLLLVQAPRGSCLEKGMTVLVETANGEETATVEAVAPWVEKGKDDESFMKALARMPEDEEYGRVLAYFRRIDIDYEE